MIKWILLGTLAAGVAYTYFHEPKQKSVEQPVSISKMQIISNTSAD